MQRGDVHRPSRLRSLQEILPGHHSLERGGVPSEAHADGPRQTGGHLPQLQVPRVLDGHPREGDRYSGEEYAEGGPQQGQGGCFLGIVKALI